MNETGSLEVLWRRKYLLVLGALLGIVAAVVFGSPSKVIAVNHYQAVDAMFVNPDLSQPELASRYAYLAMSSSVPADVATELGRYDAGEVRERIVVEADPALGSLTIISTDHRSLASATELVEAFGDKLMAFLQDDASEAHEAEVARLQQQVDAAREEAVRLSAAVPAVLAEGQVPDVLATAERDAAVGQYTTAVQNLAIAKAAQAADEPPLQRLRPVVGELEEEQEASDPLGAAGRLAIGAIVGMVLGGALAFLIHRFDSRLYGRTDVEGAFQLPVIGEIPKLPRRWRKRRGLVSADEPSSPAAESFRQLRSTVSAIHTQRLRRLAQSPEAKSGSRDELILLVASPGPGDGKSTTIANLAKAFVDAGQSVIVVSGDLRRPTMHEFLQADESPGLSEAIQEGFEPARVGELLRPTAVAGVQLLPHGEAADNPGELLAASRGLILAARDLADVILIDSPPVLIGNDVSELVPVADGILVVARVGRTTAEQAHRTRDAIDRLAAPVLGVVLVGSDELMRGVAYYGGYGKRQTRRSRMVESLRLRREWFGRRPQPSHTGAPTSITVPSRVDDDRFGLGPAPARDQPLSTAELDAPEGARAGDEQTKRTPSAAASGDKGSGNGSKDRAVADDGSKDGAAVDHGSKDLGSDDNGSDDRAADDAGEPVAPLSAATEKAGGGEHRHESTEDQPVSGVDLASLRRRVLLEHRHRPGGSPAPDAASRDDGSG